MCMFSVQLYIGKRITILTQAIVTKHYKSIFSDFCLGWKSKTKVPGKSSFWLAIFFSLPGGSLSVLSYHIICTFHCAFVWVCVCARVPVHVHVCVWRAKEERRESRNSFALIDQGPKLMNTFEQNCCPACPPSCTSVNGLGTGLEIVPWGVHWGCLFFVFCFLFFYFLFIFFAAISMDISYFFGALLSAFPVYI